MYSTLSTLNTLSLSKAPNPQLLPGRRSIMAAPLLRVCVHVWCSLLGVCALGWVTLEHNSEYGSPYLAECHFTVPINCTNSDATYVPLEGKDGRLKRAKID